MKSSKIIVLAMCAVALCLALTGCGEASQSEKAAFAGTWNLVEMSDDNGVTGSDELSLMNSLGMDVTLALNADGTAVLDTLGKQSEGTWKASSETEGTITLDSQDISIVIEEGKLSMKQAGDTLVFEKTGDAADAASSSASSASDGAADGAASATSSDASAQASESASSASSESAAAASTASASSASASSSK